MKTERNILIAFILNLIFASVELIGGLLTNSVAILSDAIHDLGDALSIGITYLLEKISKRTPDKKYTYGYARYSIIGAAFTSLILICGSILVIYHAVNRLLNPVEIYSTGMIGLAVLGIIINFTAAYFTREGNSLNQKAVNLHMMEDVLGWVVVFVGGIVIKLTNWQFIDPILSICLAIYISYHALLNLKKVVLILVEAIDDDKLGSELERWLQHVEGVQAVHHLHVWKLDETKMCATIHVVSTKQTESVKRQIRNVFEKYGIQHVTIEFEAETEQCKTPQCMLYKQKINHVSCCGGHHQAQNEKRAITLHHSDIEF